ncbi:MAG: hypothetical protein KK482_26530 [Sinorhizobium meliloti]|nr:hypothetical protein [Sinorhizobium meliloti]
MRRFQPGGLEIATEDGKLIIRNEGKFSKFVPAVEQVTFNAELAVERGQRVTYVTERAVFEGRSNGLELVEVAPGVDVERDVLRLIPFQIRVSEGLKTMEGCHFS